MVYPLFSGPCLPGKASIVITPHWHPSRWSPRTSCPVAIPSPHPNILKSLCNCNDSFDQLWYNLIRFTYLNISA